MTWTTLKGGVNELFWCNWSLVLSPQNRLSYREDVWYRPLGYHRAETYSRWLKIKGNESIPLCKIVNSQKNTARKGRKGQGNQKTIRQTSPIDNYSKCKLTEFFNQKTEWLDGKNNNYMLPTRDSLQLYRHK